MTGRGGDSPQPSICFVGGSVFDRTARSTGGSELQVLNLAECLARDHGWSVSFVVRRGSERDLDCSALPGPVRVFPGSRRFKWTTWIPGLALVLPGIGAQVFYERGANPLTVGTAFGAMIRGSRFVWAVASDRDCGAAEWMRYRMESASKNAVLRTLTRGSLSVRAALLGWAIRRAHSVFCQTNAQMAACAAGWGIPAERLHLVRNGHYLEPDVAASTRNIVAWVGSLKPIKRPELFLEIADRMRDSGVEFVMMGSAFGEPWESWVRSDAAASSNMTFVEGASHEAVLDTLRRSVVLVCTSVVEGFPNTFIEAWMSRTPVVSVGIDPDRLVSEGGLGVCVDDVGAAVEAISAFVLDEARQRTVGEACRRHAESEHDIHAVAARADAYLRSVLGN